LLYRYPDGDTTAAVSAKGPEKNVSEMSKSETQKHFQVMILQVGYNHIFINGDHTVYVRAFFHHRLK